MTDGRTAGERRRPVKVNGAMGEEDRQTAIIRTWEEEGDAIRF